MSLISGVVGLLGFTAVGTGVPAYYAWVDHHGPSRWEAYKADKKAKGQILDLDKLIDRSPIPPAKDFAAHPLISELFEDPPPAAPAIGALQFNNIVGLENTPLDKELTMGWQMAQGRNFAAYLPAGSTIDDVPQYILRCLEPHRAMLQSIAGAAERPHCQFPVHWEKGFATQVPHCTSLHLAAKALTIEASARICTGDSDGAFLALTTVIRLAKHLEAEPSLISHLVEISILAMAHQSLWEGLRAEIWDELELVRLEELLAKLDLESATVGAMQMERATMIHGVLAFKDHPFGTGVLGTQEFNPILLLPRGLWFENIRAACTLFDAGYFSQPQFPGCRIPQCDEALILERIEQWKSPLRPDRLLARNLVPVLAPISEKSVRAVANIRMARIAIAIERYRMDRREFPKTLARLTPKYLEELPVDPVTGAPFRFLLRADGSPAIWSVGFNGIDEGGRTKRKRFGDWAWQYSLPDGHDAEEFLSKDPIEDPDTK